MIFLAMGCQSLRRDVPFEDLAVRACVSELEAHGIAVPPRTNRVYVFSVAGAAVVRFSSGEAGWFGEYVCEQQGDVTSSWDCDVRIEAKSSEKPVVRFLATAYAMSIRGDGAPLVGGDDYQVVPAENPESEVRVRGYEWEGSRFVFVREMMLSEVYMEQRRRYEERPCEIWIR